MCKHHWKNFEHHWKNFERFLFDGLIFGFVNIFVFIRVDRDTDKFWWNRIVFYYILTFIENTVLFTVWFVKYGMDVNYGIPAAVVVYGGFPIGIIFLILFEYMMEAPAQDNKKWIMGPEDL